MSVFDGLGSLVASTFGASAVITPKATGIPQTVTGVFRYTLIETPTADGRDLLRQVPIFHLPASVAVLVPGDQIQPSNAPGQTFIVLDFNNATNESADALTMYRCEELL